MKMNKTLTIALIIVLVIFIFYKYSNNKVIDVYSYKLDEETSININVRKLKSFHHKVVYDDIYILHKQQIMGLGYSLRIVNEPSFYEYDINDSYYIITITECSSILLLDKKSLSGKLYRPSRDIDLNKFEFLLMQKSMLELIKSEGYYKNQQELIKFFAKYNPQLAVNIITDFKQGYPKTLNLNISKNDKIIFDKWLDEIYQNITLHQ